MESPSIRRMILESLTLLFLLHFAGFILTDTRFYDSDSFTHMVRLQSILSHGSLRATFLERLNAPYGMDLHWTLPFDLFTLGVVAPAALFMGWQKALVSYAGWSTPISHVLAVLSILWALLPVMRRLALRIVVYGTLFGGFVISYSLYGRVDHHIFMLAFWCLWLGAVIRFVLRGHQLRPGILAGFFAVVCLWISPETYPGFVWGNAVMIAAWSVRPGRCDRSAVSFALALSLFSWAALLLDPPLTGFFSINYYRFSIHTVVLTGLISLAWLAGFFCFRRSKNKAKRFAGMAFFHAAITFLYWFVYPQILNPGESLKAAEVLSHCVKEYEGVFMYSVSYSIFSAGRGLMGIAATAYLLWKDRDRPWRGALVLFTMLIAFYTLIAFKHRRFGIYTDVLALVPLAILAVRLMAHRYKNFPKTATFVSTGIFLFVLFAPQAFGLAAYGAEKIFVKKSTPAARLPAGAPPEILEAFKQLSTKEDKKCDLKDIIPALKDPSEMGKGILTITADLSLSPELLYETPHRFVAGPYGNYDALNDVIQFMYTGSVSQAHEIAKTRKVDYVLMCPFSYGWYEPPAPDSLFAHVVKGQPVDWLEETAWPSSVKTDFRLWRVRK